MRTHPVFLRLEGRRCVVVGADGPAAAKAAACLRAGADVTLVAPELPAALATEDGLRHVDRDYRPGDLAGAFLAYASTRDPGVIRQLRDEAERERVLLNVVDVPDASTFLSPAVLARGELTIAIGTGGASPGLSARLRRELEGHVGPEYGPFVAILGAIRRALGREPGRAEVLSALLDSSLLELVRRGAREEIDRLLARVAGDRLTLERLGVALGAER
ncbi:MAG: bifunctional precorrin-2 dehydrogenase/sirohydrochlorin ferrochelatase [Deltaproteobacteria bacterium]|nr:MAG: bifunctional precorrin-2 dehydrogenase/sirohydrochlorin ferrochelatase [Deltaproteobacteria bacterium]